MGEGIGINIQNIYWPLLNAPPPRSGCLLQIIETTIEYCSLRGNVFEVVNVGTFISQTICLMSFI